MGRLTSSKKVLTDRQKKFVNAYVEDPTSGTKAALKAGYSSTTARSMASRLLHDDRITSAIEQHFVDKQELTNSILNDILLHIKRTLESEDEPTKEKTKAAKIGLEYTRVAAGILGLDVKSRKKPYEDVAVYTPEELIRHYEIELEAAKKIAEQIRGSANTIENTTPEAGEGTLHKELSALPEGGSGVH